MRSVEKRLTAKASGRSGLGTLLAAALLTMSACTSVDPVEMVGPTAPLFVGQYHRVEIRIDPATGLTLSELAFEVTGGPLAGEVSLSRERGADPKRPEIMLLAGPRPGSYELIAREAATAAELDRIPFEVTTQWQDDDAGPGVWFTGAPTSQAAGSAWGGGPGTPQNLNVSPQSGTRNVAIVLVDTSTQRYTAAEGTATSTTWEDEAEDGVTTGGVTRSVADYYSEVSYGNFTITAQAFGPYQLSGPFTDHFFWGDADPNNFDGKPKGGFFQACITAADADVNFNNFQSVLCLSRSIDATNRFAWPYASIGAWGPYTTAEGNFNLGVASMPFDWNVLDAREIHETLAHELGHNLGLGDQYTPSVPMPNPPPGSRNLGSWELMDAENPLPHLSAPHRMMLGWVPAGWIRQFDFSTIAVPVDQTINLQAIESGAPSAGRSSVIEIRIADGWNYYLAHRRAQAGHIGDQNLPVNSSVLGVDVTSAPWTPPISRPGLLRLANDPDGDGSVLQAGGNYRETDTSDPTFPTDFRLDVTGITGDVAAVRVRYGVNSKPDPSIRPWPASADRRWQSPDIEVRNAKNAADPSLFNLPWAENPNTIAAQIKNRGNLAAGSVTANFFVKDYTVSGGPETFLGSDTNDIGAGATVEFTAPWTPPRAGHFCIVVRIPLYQTPGTPSVVELTEFNNVAQSNYGRYISATASPGTREVGSVLVSNPYAERTRLFLVGSQTNPYYRTYVGNRWVVLDPGEERRVPVMFEYADALPGLGDEYKDPSAAHERLRRLPNDAAIVSFIEDPRPPRIDSADEYGGVQARVVTGRATRIDLSVDDEVAGGQVTTVDDGQPVAGGRVIVSVEADSVGRGRGGHQVVAVVQGGFQARIPRDAEIVHATYLPVAGLAESEASSKRQE